MPSLLRACLWLCLSGLVVAQSRPEPVEVRVLMLVADVTAIDSQEQTVDVDFILRMTWRDPSLAHEGENVLRPLSEVWNPRGIFVNGSRLREVRPRVVEIAPDGLVVYRQRYVGPLSQRFDYADFPMDRQLMRLDLLSTREQDEVRLVPDERSGRLEGFSIPDWRVGEAQVAVDSRAALGEVYPGVSVTMPIRRRVSFYIWKVLVPLMMIVFMSWSVFWISPEQAGPQIGVAATSMLTLIAYRFTLGQMLPNLPYMTRMDHFITGASMLVFLALIEVVATSSLAGNDKVGAAKRIDAVCRWVFPLLCGAVLLYSFWL